MMKKPKQTSILNIKNYHKGVGNKEPITDKAVKSGNNCRGKTTLHAAWEKELQEKIELIRKNMDETPDMREAKIAALRDAIEKGTYIVPSKKVAEKIIREFLLDLKYHSEDKRC